MTQETEGKVMDAETTFQTYTIYYREFFANPCVWQKATATDLTMARHLWKALHDGGFVMEGKMPD